MTSLLPITSAPLGYAVTIGFNQRQPARSIALTLSMIQQRQVWTTLYMYENCACEALEVWVKFQRAGLKI